MKILPILFCCAGLSVGLSSAFGADAPVPASAGPTIAAPRTPDGFTVVNGRVFFVRDAKMMPLDREVVLRVSPSGRITAFNGQEYAIPEGQVLTLAVGVAGLPPGTAAVASQVAATTPAPGGTTTSSSTGTATGSTDAGSAANSTPSYGASGVPVNGGGDNSLYDLFGVTSVIPGMQPMLGPNNGLAAPLANPVGAALNTTGNIQNGTVTNANGTTNTNGTTNSNTGSVNGTNGTTPLSPTAVGNQQNIGSQQISPGSNNLGNAQNPAIVGNQQQLNGTQQSPNQNNINAANAAATGTPANGGTQQFVPGTNTPTGNAGTVAPGAPQQPGARQPLNPTTNGQTATPNGTTQSPNAAATNRTGGTTTGGTTGHSTGGTTGGTTGGSTGGAAAGGGGGGHR